MERAPNAARECAKRVPTYERRWTSAGTERAGRTPPEKALSANGESAARERAERAPPENALGATEIALGAGEDSAGWRWR